MATTAFAEQLYDTARERLSHTELRNGAFTAVDVTNPEMGTYGGTYGTHVWVRDATHHAEALHLLAPEEAPRIIGGFGLWMVTKAEGIAVRAPGYFGGVWLKRNMASGAVDRNYDPCFQPDQNGAWLDFIGKHRSEYHEDKAITRSVHLMADGLAHEWKLGDKHFRSTTEELWENRQADPKKGEVFTLSADLAARGLDAAIHMHGDKERWVQARDEIRSVLGNVPFAIFDRKTIINPETDTYVRDPDDQPLDASLLYMEGWTDENGQNPLEKQYLTTLDAIKQQLWTPEIGGVVRYMEDTYDGILRYNGQEGGAGSWPLLSFALATALKKVGKDKEAHDVFDHIVNYLEELIANKKLTPGQLIPEQVFSHDDDRNGEGVVDLAWATAEYVKAYHTLFINK